jgi:hypothetical protein
MELMNYEENIKLRNIFVIFNVVAYGMDGWCWSEFSFKVRHNAKLEPHNTS